MQFNSFFVYVTPFLGAILADTKWGRYKTICVFTIVILCVPLTFFLPPFVLFL